MKKQNFGELTSEAINNIREDREQTKELLQDLVKYLSGADERHKEVGLTAAKYMETLQRSNEQLVKIASLKQKSEVGDTSLSEQERAEIFDQLNKE
jgi:F0F1-type ATP synthase membrane subunit b/b'